VKRYINEFVRLDCAPDILALKLFPNAKEITESMAAFHAVRAHIVNQCGASFDNKNIATVCIGDGHTPRTAALFAFRTAWACYSIDPKLRKIVWDIKRLIPYDERIEDVILDLRYFDQVIMLQVHSHADLATSLENIKAKRMHVVAIPCCIPMEIPGRYYIGYEDMSIWSPENTVKVWRDIVRL
jgi:hypothetical protein